MSSDFHAALHAFKDECIMFHSFDLAYQQMKNNLALYRDAGVATHLLVLGESGSGKTTLAELFARRYPPSLVQDRTIYTVLLVSVPAAATIASLVEEILAQLGDPQPSSGNISNKTRRAVFLIAQCHVEVLLIDEAQHVADRGLSKTHYFVADWLKSFIDAIGIPVVMLGLQRTKDILQANEQLRRRFTAQIDLISQAGPADEESLNYLLNLAQPLGIKIDWSPHTAEQFATRLSFATDGRIAYVKLLLLEAFKNVLIQGINVVSLKDFHAAFPKAIWSNAKGALNPFDDAFHPRRLDGINEPFQEPAFIVPSRAQRKK